MTDAQYLHARGWFAAHLPGVVGHAWNDGSFIAPLREEQALAVQRARDAMEKRRAWAQFAAAELSAMADSPAAAAQVADALLAEFSKRFDPEVGE